MNRVSSQSVAHHAGTNLPRRNVLIAGALALTGSNINMLKGIHAAQVPSPSTQFLEDNFWKVYDQMLIDQEHKNKTAFTKKITELANSVLQKSLQSYEITSASGSVHFLPNAEPQVSVARDLSGEIYKILKHLYPDDNPDTLLTEAGFFWNHSLDRDLYFNNNRDYYSVEDHLRDQALSKDQAVLFIPVAKRFTVDLKHHSYDETMNYFKELFPNLNFKREAKINLIKHPAYLSLGSCAQGNIFLNEPRLMKIAQRNGNGIHKERYATIVNEFLHHLLFRLFDEKSKDFYKSGLFVGSSYGTVHQVQKPKEVEEALSDISSMAFHKRYFLDMLSSSYDFSNALAHKFLKEIIPDAANDQAKSWRVFSFDDMEEYFIRQLRNQGFNDPDLEEQIYKPIFDKMKQFALDRMQEIHQSLA